MHPNTYKDNGILICSSSTKGLRPSPCISLQSITKQSLVSLVVQVQLRSSYNYWQGHNLVNTQALVLWQRKLSKGEVLGKSKWRKDPRTLTVSGSRSKRRRTNLCMAQKSCILFWFMEQWECKWNNMLYMNLTKTVIWTSMLLQGSDEGPLPWKHVTENNIENIGKIVCISQVLPKANFVCYLYSKKIVL